VQIANEIYAPTPAEVEYAQGLLEAMRAAEKAGDGAVRFRGMMVDYAMMPEAEGLLREAQRRGIKPAPSPK
jgi:citrate lyase subunit beta/citryl-CoA lyase